MSEVLAGPVSVVHQPSSPPPLPRYITARLTSMPFEAARSRMESAKAKYDALGVEKSPGVVKGTSPRRLAGYPTANLCSNKFIFTELNPFACRSAKYISASAGVRLAIRDCAESP